MEKVTTLYEFGTIKAYSKCLVQGGYWIVLDGQKGIVLQCEDYFTCRIQKNNAQKEQLVVKSIQFPEPNSESFNFDSLRDLELKKADGNPYIRVPVQAALQYVLLYHFDSFQEYFGEKSDGILIEIVETQGYINTQHHLQPTLINETQIGPKFKDFDEPVSQCAKTGMGSSSGVIVLMVRAILHLCMGEKINNQLSVVNWLAQMSNYIIQNKIGSGFDITAAVFGSCLFSRIQKEKMELFTEKWKQLILEEHNGELRKQIEEFWNHEMPILPYKVGMGGPSSNLVKDKLKQVFVQFNKGTNTVNMVQMVLQTIRDNKANPMGKENREIVRKFDKLMQTPISEANIQQVITTFRQLLSQSNNLIERLQDEVMEDQEKLFTKIFPSEAKCLIEKAFTTLKTDQDIQLVWGCCPGAGGYDDIVFLVLGDAQKLKLKLKEVIEGMANLDEHELDAMGIHLDILKSLVVK